MKIVISSVLLLSFPTFIQSLRFGLLRITETNDGSTPNSKQSSVADFRSLFDEDVKFNFRGLFDESLSFSLSMSFPLQYKPPKQIFTKPTTVPTISPPTTIAIVSPVAFPIPNPAIDFTDNNRSDTDAAVESDNQDSTSKGNATSPASAETSSKNVALIVVGSCALVALVAIAMKKMSQQPSKASSSLKGASTPASVNDTGSSSNEVSSVGSTSDYGINSDAHL